MECKRHPGQEASFTCMNCGQSFCRQCVQETRESHYCPDCHQAEVDRFASKLGPREPKAKAKKAKKEKKEKKKEPVARKEKKEKKEKVKKKQLKKPAEQPVAAPPEAAVAPPPPPPEISSPEKEEFWGDIKEPRRAAGHNLEEEFHPPQEPVAETEGEPALVPEGEKRRVLTSEERQQAVMVSEGFPTGPVDEKQQQAPAGEGKHAAVKERHLPGEEHISMQVPMDYDGEVTKSPSYIKAVLWGLLAGVLGAAAYAGLAWWLHWDRGIFGWVIGFAVGVAVAFGSGRHFNWKLGLIAAVIAMFFVSAGRIAYYILDVKFNDFFHLPLGYGTLFNEAISKYYHEFLSLWLVFFLIAGLVAFIIAFRPPPIRLQLSSTTSAR